MITCMDDAILKAASKSKNLFMEKILTGSATQLSSIAKV